MNKIRLELSYDFKSCDIFFYARKNFLSASYTSISGKSDYCFLSNQNFSGINPRKKITKRFYSNYL